ncbi:hypothetical protein Tco_0651665 [Tanacetum coccineum]|uniref:Uncharacterized protein n=1 Tax=Tanacetum coccineum TaxID=301880 RepID=A0ABQ4WW35_9ASTR
MWSKSLTGNPQREVVNFLAGTHYLHAKSKPCGHFTTEANMLLAASCWGHVLWIQNQLLGLWVQIPEHKGSTLIMKAPLHVKNPVVYHSKSKHILLDTTSYKDAYEKKLIQALISLTDDLSLLSNMAALESCPKHNMIAYLEKTEGNVEFHEVIDFLRRSYISHALTDEGASSERLSVEQPSPSPTPTSDVPNESLPDSTSAQPSEVPFEQQPDPSPRTSPRPSPRTSPTRIVPDSIPEPTGENLGDHSSNDTSLSGFSDSQKNAQSEWGQRNVVDDKEIDDDRLSTEITDELDEGTESAKRGYEEIFEVLKEQREHKGRKKMKRMDESKVKDDDILKLSLVNQNSAEKLQSKEREQFTIEEEGLIPYDTMCSEEFPCSHKDRGP